MRSTTLISLSCILTLALSLPTSAAGKRPRDPVTDVKSLEAQVASAKADLDKARAAAATEYQSKSEYQRAKADLDAKKAALDKARESGTEKDKTDASNAYTRARLDFDKLVQQFEESNETVVASRKTWEAAVKELADFKRHLAGNAKQLDGQRGILASLPRDYWAQEGRGWTPLQQKAANKWLAENLVGQKIRVSGNASSISEGRSRRGASIRMEKPEITMGERKISGSIIANFGDSAIADLRKLHKDSPVAIEGTLGATHIYWHTDGPIEINVTIESSSLVSR